MVSVNPSRLSMISEQRYRCLRGRRDEEPWSLPVPLGTLLSPLIPLLLTVVQGKETLGPSTTGCTTTNVESHWNLFNTGSRLETKIVNFFIYLFFLVL